MEGNAEEWEGVGDEQSTEAHAPGSLQLKQVEATCGGK